MHDRWTANSPRLPYSLKKRRGKLNSVLMKPVESVEGCCSAAADRSEEWHPWSQCSATCGLGRRQRLRDIDEDLT